MPRFMVKVKEEMQNMQRLHYGPRDDLQSVLEADVPSEAKRAARRLFEDKGYEVISAVIGVGVITVIIRSKQTDMKSPLLYKRNPQPVKVTGAGRIR